ncbi:MAG: hypothetical protein V4671_31835 [Armatimonadota bacterium]
MPAGITGEQAARLFTGLGGLDSHAQIEGTGLGLLSAAKIVEVHSGEAYVDGYTDGTPESRPFTTATGSYPRLLPRHEAYRTAFVVTCPLAAKSLRDICV